jgi:MOSC domain-containing protein YiiM
VAWVRISPQSGQSHDVASLNLVEGRGIEGDRHAKPNKRNQVLLIERETLEEFDLQPGDVRENIATRGVELMRLREGDRLRIGPDVELVASHACPPCGKMDALRDGLRQALEGRRGMLATVAGGGVITPGDAITITRPPR